MGEVCCLLQVGENNKHNASAEQVVHIPNKNTMFHVNHTKRSRCAPLSTDMKASLEVVTTPPRKISTTKTSNKMKFVGSAFDHRIGASVLFTVVVLERQGSRRAGYFGRSRVEGAEIRGVGRCNYSCSSRKGEHGAQELGLDRAGAGAGVWVRYDEHLLLLRRRRPTIPLWLEGGV